MPIYEFHCRRCRLEFELLTRMDSNGTRCPGCGGEDVVRRFSVFGMKSSGRFQSSLKSSCTGCPGGDCGGCAH